MVMRKTQKTHLLRTIQKNIVSFLAVAMMAATGISIFLGNQSAAEAILLKANDHFVENKLHSLEVASVYGITEDDEANGETKIQNITDKFCKEVDSMASDKEKEIMEI